MADATSAPTVADVLALPVLATARPRVMTGESQLDRRVRWVHITELTDPASFLKGGELVLTTGVPLPTEPVRVRRYVDELADAGAAGLVIELIRRYRRAPEVLVSACRARDLPLITLSEEVNFIDITQVVHALILGNQADAIRRSQLIHERFTALTLRGAGPQEVVRTAAGMVGSPVVLENLVHRAVLCEPAGRPVEEVLAGWEPRSRATPASDAPAVHGPESWLVTPVEYRGERWGRVAMLAGPAPGTDEITVLERTAMALTITRLIHPANWERGAHRSVLVDLAEQRYRSAGEARARAEALGLPTEGGRFLATLIDLGESGDPEEPAGLEDRLATDLAAAGIPALVGQLAGGRIGLLLAPGRGAGWRPVMERLGRDVRARHPRAIVSVGSEVDDVTHVARSFWDAARVAEAALPSAAGQPFYEPADIGLPQLLYALREDVRVQDYAERQIGPLVDYDARHDTNLVATLRHYLDAAGNKTVAARRGELSRQTLYQRLHMIERLLGRDLESGAQRTELHVALTALDSLRLG